MLRTAQRTSRARWLSCLTSQDVMNNTRKMNQLHRAEFLRILSRKFSYFVDPENLLVFTQTRHLSIFSARYILPTPFHTTYVISISILSSHLSLSLPGGYFLPFPPPSSSIETVHKYQPLGPDCLIFLLLISRIIYYLMGSADCAARHCAVLCSVMVLFSF